VTIGAIATILSAASDPFLQAVVTYEGRLDTISDRAVAAGNLSDARSAAVARSTRWAGLDTFAYRNQTSTSILVASCLYPSLMNIALNNADGNHYVTSPKREDFSINSAFYSGTMASPSIGLKGEMPYTSCASGNCTSSVYTSVGICSNCTDISRLIQKLQPTGQSRPEAVRRTTEALSSEESSERGSLTNYTLNNLWIDNLGNKGSNTYASFMTAALSLRPEDTNVFQDMETLLGAVTFLTANPSWGPSNHWSDLPPTATECALYLCVNAYQSSFSKGVLREDLVGSWAARISSSYAPSPQQPDAVQINDVATTHSDTWMTPYQTGYLNRTDYQLSIPMNSTDTPVHGKDAVFSISQAAIVSFQDFLTTTFTTLPDTTHELVYGRSDSPLYTSPILAPWFEAANGSDLTMLFGYVASSVTSAIRNSRLDAAANFERYDMQEWVLHFKIVWGFFVWPFLTTVIGSLFTIYTVLRTKKSALPIWKTSLLANLVHGLDEGHRGMLRPLHLRAQKEVAKSMLMILEESNGVMETKGAH
jgi:hypothetical protein